MANVTGGGFLGGLFAPGKVKPIRNRPKKDPFGQAKKDLGQLGDEQTKFYMGGLDRSLGQFGEADKAYGGAKDYWAGLYGQGGQLSGPGALEQRYESLAKGGDPTDAYLRQQGQQGIDNAFASRGLNNSGAAIQASSLMQSDFNAKRARDLDALAGGAQSAKEGRLGGGFQGSMDLGGLAGGLAGSKAGLTQGAYNQAANAQMQTRMAQIEADLAKANLSAQERARLQAEKSSLWKSLLNTGAGLAGLYLGGPGGAAAASAGTRLLTGGGDFYDPWAQT